MLSKRLIKEVCIHEASHLYIAKILGNTILGMELNVKNGWARVSHSDDIKNDCYKAAIKVAGYLGDKLVSKQDIKFRSGAYATQLTDNGIIFGDYDEFKLLNLTINQERKIIRIVTSIISKNQNKIREMANYFISRMDKNQNIVIKKVEINKLSKRLGIVKDDEISSRLTI